MKIATLGLLAALSAGFAGSALAGVNEGGYLLLHTDDSVIYTADDEGTYCQILGSECPFDPECDDVSTVCEDFLENDIVVTSGRGVETAMIWAIAAFPPSSCPEVAAVQFGLSWDPAEEPTFVAWGTCGDFELGTEGWPTELNSGTAVTWSNAINRTGFPVYWFAAYSYYAPLEISVADFPTGTTGAAFADESVPSILDKILSPNRGVIGLNGATGDNPYVGVTPTLESSWGEVKAIFGR